MRYKTGGQLNIRKKLKLTHCVYIRMPYRPDKDQNNCERCTEGKFLTSTLISLQLTVTMYLTAAKHLSYYLI